MSCFGLWASLANLATSAFPGKQARRRVRDDFGFAYLGCRCELQVTSYRMRLERVSLNGAYPRRNLVLV